MVNARKLVVYHPNTRLPERRYIMDVVLRDFLGFEYESHDASQSDTIIIIDGDPAKRRLRLSDVLLQMPDSYWLSYESLPRRPLRMWNISDDLPEARVVGSQIPIIYGRPVSNGLFYEHRNGEASLGLDVFGSAFFMLTRYEEMVIRERDKHNRFPAAESLAYREGFLDRPIVDEYVEILWTCMRRLWPGVDRKKRQYRLILTHDVDHPFAVLNKSWIEVLRSSAGDVLNRKDITLALSRMRAKISSQSGNYDGDPYNTFDFIMDVSERNGLASTFYFITGYRHGDHMNGNYSINMPWIARLMRTIHLRGHQIGLHPSYDSYMDGTKIREEFSRLLEVAKRENIVQHEWGSRQHYLRWAAPTTWRLLAEAGISHDSTLCFADYIGFRCGVCHEYTVYDLENRQALKLRERPLIAMDVTLLGSQYMHLSLKRAFCLLESVSKRCKFVDGDLVLLFHNNTLSTRSARSFYTEVVKACLS